MRTLLLALAVVLGVLSSAPPAAAQAPGAGGVQQSAPSAAPSEGAAGLPRYTPPRTLRAYWHLFVAFAVAWVLVFGYTVSIARRFGRIERELEAFRAG